MSFLSPYRAALRAPHARAAFLSSLTGRLAYGTVSLSLILTLTAGGRGYGLAGVVMALFGLAVVLASPLRARLVDRHGPRRALPPMAAGFAVALTALALVAPRPGPGDAAVAALAVAAGACAPPLGVVMRTLWSALAADRAALQAAYSLDGVAEELLYVTGPVLTGLVTALAAPAAGLLVSAGLAAAGTGLFLRSPAVRRWPDLVTGPEPPAPGAAPSGARAAGAAWPAALAAAAAGLCLGGLGLVIAAFCQARHDPAAVAWTEAALSAGSALGGLAYGALPWRIPARRRLALLVAGLAVLLAPAGLSPGVPALAALAALAGVLVSPALATAYVLADALAPPAARNRAGNWVSSGFNAGSASGAAACGQLAGRVPLGACLPLLAVPALLAAVPLLLPRPARRRAAGPAAPAASGGSRTPAGAFWLSSAVHDAARSFSRRTYRQLSSTSSSSASGSASRTSTAAIRAALAGRCARFAPTVWLTCSPRSTRATRGGRIRR